MLNAFFNYSITKEDMRLMNEQYDGQLAELSDCLTAVMRQQEKTTFLETLHRELKSVSDRSGRDFPEFVAGKVGSYGRKSRRIAKVRSKAGKPSCTNGLRLGVAA